MPEKKYISFNCLFAAKRNGNCLVYFFLFSSFHTWDCIAGSQTGATKTRIELISCVLKSVVRRLYTFMPEPIDFVKLSYNFSSSSSFSKWALSWSNTQFISWLIFFPVENEERD